MLKLLKNNFLLRPLILQNWLTFRGDICPEPGIGDTKLDGRVEDVSGGSSVRHADWIDVVESPTNAESRRSGAVHPHACGGLIGKGTVGCSDDTLRTVGEQRRTALANVWQSVNCSANIWPIYMAYICGLYIWPIYMAYVAYIYMAYTYGLYNIWPMQDMAKGP